MAGLSADAHLNYFTNYVLTLLRDFSNYLTATEETNGEIDMLADRVGYTEVKFYANLEELTQFAVALNQAILPLMQNEAGNGRFLYKVATIAHPERTPKGKKS